MEVYDQSNKIYSTNKQIRFKTSDLCDYSDAYIVAKGTIGVEKPDKNANDKKLAFKSNESFIGGISKINNTLINNIEDLDIVMPMYTLIEYSKNYSKTGKFTELLQR